jgi:hypothetical protein
MSSNAILEALNNLARRIRRLETLRYSPGSGGGGHTIMDEGVALPDQPYLDFVGAGVTATNDVLNNKTVVTIPGGGGGGADMNLQQVILLDLSAGISRHYTPNSAGLASAIAMSGTGDIVLLPAATFTSNITIPYGVEVIGLGRDKTIIVGQVSGSENSVLSAATVHRALASSETLFGVIAPSTGEYNVDPKDRTCFQVIDCDIKVENTASGSAYGFSTTNGGHLYLEQCRVEAVSAGGVGYAGLYAASFWMEQGMARGSTGRFVRYTL